VDIVLATVAAALIGALGPWVIRLLPEPVNPAADKPLYASIAQARWLGLWLALAGGLMAAVVAAGTNLTLLLPAWVVVCGVGSWLAYIDFRTQLLPYKLTAPLHAVTLALVGGGAAITGEWSVAVKGLIGMVVVFVVFWLAYFFGRLYKGGALGYGDVRLAAILGLVLGPIGLVATEAGMFAGFLLGGLVGVVSGKWRQYYALGPYLVVGAVLGAVWPNVVG
jgi:leader peptidase (prepilin peptidase)/N-methyltransferase